MATQLTTTVKNDLATKFGQDAAYGALCTTACTTSALGTEVSGGSPAYARISAGWGAASGGAVTSAAMAFNVPASTTVVSLGFVSTASGANTYYAGCDITSQTFASQGTYTITATYTQS
jgi:hypothetical protein